MTSCRSIRALPVGIGCATPGRPGKVRKLKTYELTLGHAHTYNEGVMHSPWRERPARMIRIEGGHIEREGALDYEIV
jgi:hypothetical protein